MSAEQDVTDAGADPEADGEAGERGEGGERHRVATIVNQKGLHARAAAKFAKTTGGYRSKVTVERGEYSVDGRSIMGLMMLAATPGTEIHIQAVGADADAALDALVALVESGFGEDN